MKHAGNPPVLYYFGMASLLLILSSCNPQYAVPLTSTPFAAGSTTSPTGTTFPDSTATTPNESNLTLTPLSPVLSTATAQGIGATWTRPEDGMVMMYVPAGQFSMGSPDGTGKNDEQPQHMVFLDAFWVDRTDVTNAMYAVCVKAGGCKLPYSTGSVTRSDYYGNAQYANYPVVNVDWNEAAAYCGWVGQASGVKVSLPTEAQWEKAARGTDGRTYPWGNDSPDKSLLNFNDQVGDTSVVGSYPSGASPYGALDMAGNVWEWVNDWYDAAYYANSPASNPQGPSSGSARVLRGGAWTGSEDLVRSSTRLTHNPVLGNSLFGFRCVRSR